MSAGRLFSFYIYAICILCTLTGSVLEYWIPGSNILGLLKINWKGCSAEFSSDPGPESYQLSIYHFNQANVSHSNVVYYTFLKVRRDLSDFIKSSSLQKFTTTKNHFSLLLTWLLLKWSNLIKLFSLLLYIQRMEFAQF